MKRLLILLIILLIPFATLAIPPFVTSSGIVIPTDDCSGDLKFAWHMETTDVTTGSPAGCSDGDTTATANSTVSLSATQKQDGTNAIFADNASEYYTFTVSGTDLIDHAEGKIIMYLYVDVYSDEGFLKMDDATSFGDDWLLANFSGASDAVDITIATNRGGVFDNIICDANKSDDTWIYMEYRWKTGVAGNDHYLKVCDEDGVSNCTTQEEDDDLPASVNRTFINIGTDGGQTVLETYIDNIKIYGTSGY